MAKRATLPNWNTLEAMHKSPEDARFDIQIPKELKDVKTEMRSAPTSNPSRPRALVIGYNPEDRKLLIIFRDNTWWEYRNVPVETWMGLKGSTSTGAFLKSSGLDGWGDMGPAVMDALSEGTRAQFSHSAATAHRMQAGMLTADQFLFGK